MGALNMKKTFSLIFFLVLVALIAWVSSAVTVPEVKVSSVDAQNNGGVYWYVWLNKPSWQPPAYVFGPVWTILYIMIAVSGWLVWQKLPTEKFSKKFTSLIMAPYWLQLLFNFLWSIFFFGLHQPQLSLFDIVALLVVIGINIGMFIRISRTATWLLVPYFIWVGYATSLNAAIVSLN